MHLKYQDTTMKKFLLVVLVLFMFAGSPLLTACSGITGNNPPPSQAALSSTSTSTFTSNSDTESNSNSANSFQTFENDPNILGDFVDGLNNHQVEDLLNLFNEEAILTQVNQFNLGTTLTSDMEYQTSSGKAGIKSWLEYQSAAITGVMPQEYAVSANSVTLYALFYYPDYVEHVRMDAQILGGRFEVFFFYIEKITYS
jgi:hypothetical protein